MEARGIWGRVLEIMKKLFWDDVIGMSWEQHREA
jgi:hypothetical protein